MKSILTGLLAVSLLGGANVPANDFKALFAKHWQISKEFTLASTRLKIVGVRVRGFTQHQFRALQGHPVVSDLAHDPIPRTGYGPIRRLERSVVCSGESPIC